MREGVWARDGGRGVVGVAAGRFSEASDVVEVETVSEYGSAVAEADDRLGALAMGKRSQLSDTVCGEARAPGTHVTV